MSSLSQKVTSFAKQSVARAGLDVTKRGRNRAKWLRDLEIRTILDIGANVGQFAREARSWLPDATIYSFEPLEECFEALVRMSSADRRMTAFHLALGVEDGEMEINRSEFSPSSSLREMATAHAENFPFTTRISKERVDVRRLDSITRDLDMNREILVKIDVQGYEDHVISGGLDTLGLARCVLIEVSFVPLYVGQQLFEGIDRQLNIAGFRFRGCLNQLWSPLDGRVLSADAIYLKG